MTTLQSLVYFKTELAVLAGACITLFFDFWGPSKKAPFLAALLTLATAAFFALEPQTQNLSLFQGFYSLDGFSSFFRLFILAVTAITVIMSLSYPAIRVSFFSEYLALLLFLAFALMLMGGASNLLMLFLAIEFVSLLSYLLTGFSKTNGRSKEAALKYFLFGSFCSLIMLYGISILFGLAGSLDFHAVKQVLTNPGSTLAAMTALFFVLTGLGFKISIFPFHFWAPDVYNGAPTPVAAFFTVVPKALGFGLLIRVLLSVFPDLSEIWLQTLYALSILTMTLGNMLALAQTSVKRLIAYSSVAQAGYMLMGLAVFTELGIQAVFVYLIAYAVTNMGAFIALAAAAGTEEDDSLNAFAGLSKRAPFVAASMVFFLLSLAGIPPLAGFIGKFWIFAAALESGYILLALAAAINSVIAGFYYFKVIRAMYLTESLPGTPALQVPASLNFAILITLIATLLFGLFPSLLVSFTSAVF